MISRIPLAVMVSIAALLAACNGGGDAGQPEMKLPEAGAAAKPGRYGSISPQALVDSVNTSSNAQYIFLRTELPPDPSLFMGIPGMREEQAGDLLIRSTQLDRHRTLILICIYGDDSRRLARQLSQIGFDAYFLDGGLYRFTGELTKHGWVLRPPKSN